MSRTRQWYVVRYGTPAVNAAGSVVRRMVVEHRSARMARGCVRRALPAAPILGTVKVERRFRPRLRALLDEIEAHAAETMLRKPARRS